MFRCDRMEYELARKENGDIRLMVRGSSRYKRVVTQAFSSLKFSRDFIDKLGRYDWGIFINQPRCDQDFRQPQIGRIRSSEK